MGMVTLTSFEDVGAALRNPDLKQCMYDAGAVVMDQVLLTLHGDAHRQRRTLEFRVFRRDYFRYYENEVFPRTLGETVKPYLEAGRADLIDLGYRVTMNLTADFAGIDRPKRTPDETEQLLKLAKCFSEAATMVHTTRNPEDVNTEARAGLVEFERDFLLPSIARHQELIDQFNRGEIGEDALPRDVLTVLLRNEDKLDLPLHILRGELAFYLQAGSHSTANSAVHAFHEVWNWCDKHPEDRARLMRDPVFLQRCVHESLRLHTASPEAQRRPTCPMTLSNGAHVGEDDLVQISLSGANRDKSIFGEDADQYNPHREVKGSTPLVGMTFGTGVHSCLGRDLDGGVVPRADADPATIQLGIVPKFVGALFAAGARPDPANPPQRATYTSRPNWGSYPVLFDTPTA